VPMTNDACGPRRNAAALAMSVLVPIRPDGLARAHVDVSGRYLIAVRRLIWRLPRQRQCR
jgi:hypothetical protein